MLPSLRPKDVTPWAILSWGLTLLHSMSTTSAADLSINGTSHGVSVPYSVLGRRSPRPSDRSRLGAPGGCPEIRRRLPAASYGATHRFSQPHSGNCSSLNRPAIFRRVTLLGFSFQGFIPPTQPRRLIIAGMPPSRSSCESGLSPPRREPSRAQETIDLGFSPLPPLAAFGAFVRVGIDPRRQAMFSVPAADLPLLGFHLPMV